MPTKPRTFRPHPAHRPAERRPSAALRGYDRKWQALRLAHLLANPLCVACARAGRTAAAEEVDHVRPFDGPADPLRLEPGNLQSLCKRCHSQKTNREDGGGFRKGNQHGSRW